MIIDNLQNNIIKKGKINLSIKEKKIKLESSLFEIKDIGKVTSDFRYYENNGDLIFASENIFEITNKKQFSRKCMNHMDLLNIPLLLFLV